MIEKELSKPIGIFNVFTPAIKKYAYHYNSTSTAPSNPSNNNQQNKNNSHPLNETSEPNGPLLPEPNGSLLHEPNGPLSLPEPNDELASCPHLESYEQDEYTFININQKQYHAVLRRRKIRQMMGISVVKKNRKRKRNCMMKDESFNMNIYHDNTDQPPTKKKKKKKKQKKKKK
eukprot:298993_1